MNKILVAGALAAGLLTTVSALAEDVAPACMAAAERMMQVGAEVDADFSAALTAKSTDERTTVLQAIALDLQNGDMCGLVLALPESSIRALAVIGMQ